MAIVIDGLFSDERWRANVLMLILYVARDNLARKPAESNVNAGDFMFKDQVY